MKYHAARLSAIPVRMDITPLKELVKVPGMSALYRLTVYYVDGRAYNNVATLYDRAHERDKTLEVAHEGLFNHKPRQYSVSGQAYEQFRAALERSRFDDLGDAADVESESRTLWLLERICGSFYHGIVLSPHQGLKPYTAIINAVDAYLSDALREIERT